MRDETFRESTGRTIGEWAEMIEAEGLAEASHKEIADYLHAQHEVSYWWAQEITVEYEKRAGRRVEGQTADGLFQIGVRRTIDAPVQRVWDAVVSDGFLALLGVLTVNGAAENRPSRIDVESRDEERMASLDVTSTDGVSVKTTTFKSGVRIRMQWSKPGWTTHSILQITIVPKAGKRSVLAFHQEKLPDAAAREEMRERWKETAQAVATSVVGEL